MKEKFPNLVKEIDMQVQEAQRVQNKLVAKRPAPRHIIIKMPKVKDKERILKAAKGKLSVTYRRVPIMSADFSKEILQARRDWQEIFQVMKSRDLQPRLLYPAKLSFRIEEQIKSFPNKKNLTEFIIAKPLLYEMLKGLNKIKTMNNKMAKNTNVSTVECKKETMQTRRRETESWTWRAF